MSEKPTTSKAGFSPDWLVRGVLTKLGDTFDRLTGRGWRPSSSLATSELIERLKSLLDSEARDEGKKGVFVPHNIKLKMQWDKFSTDSESSMAKLENELLASAIDHINDKRYYTYAPLAIQVKADYFTSGVQMLVSFEKFSGEEHEAAVNVTIPGLKTSDILPPDMATAEPAEETFVARFAIGGNAKEVKLTLRLGSRISVGRTKENALSLDDTSVSKIHASLALNAQGGFVVADTGSTNGTFVNGERISYGKTATIRKDDKLKFGVIEVSFERIAKPPEIAAHPEPEKTETYAIGEFEFRKPAETPNAIPHADAGPSVMKIEPVVGTPEPAPTEQAIEYDFSENEKKVEDGPA